MRPAGMPRCEARFDRDGGMADVDERVLACPDASFRIFLALLRGHHASSSCIVDLLSVRWVR